MQKIINKPEKSDKGNSNYFQTSYALDKMLKYSFKYDKELNLTKITDANSFFKNNEEFHDKIIQYLVDMVQGICSNSFDLLVNQKCSQSQAKCYASKNILQNIKYLCIQLSNRFKNIEKQQILQQIKKEYFNLQIQKSYLLKLNKNKQKKYEKRSQMFEQLRRQIVVFIRKQLHVIINQVFFKYPSTPMSGYSQKLVDKIIPIDITQDYRFDFLFINKIMITKSSNKEELISKIMEFLNKAIALPHEPICQEGQTYYQSFIKFNKHLAWIISQPNITEESIENDKNLIKFLLQKTKKTYKKSGLNLYSSRKQGEIHTLECKKFNLNQHIYQHYIKNFEKKQQIERIIQKNTQEFISTHKCYANSKIPKNTKPYNQTQIANAQLKINSSSLLRILTKWVKNNINLIKRSQKYIRDNNYDFKIVSQDKEQLIELDQISKKILYKSAKNVYKNSNQKQSDLNNKFIIDCLMEEQAQIKYNFENSLKCASQLNAFVAKETIKRLISWFQVLFQISQGTDNQIQKELESIRNIFDVQKRRKQLQLVKRVNLLNNRIGDLLRSKIYCTEPEFIKLLTLLYELDKYQMSNKTQGSLPFFKLIRVKNKLKQRTNNVLINYMFYGKIQCEVQICFLISYKDKKIQKTNAMHHYLYQLTRGIYGIIPQLANIVNQNDPVSTFNQCSNLIHTKYQDESFKISKFQQRAISQSQKEEYLWRCIYKECSELSLQGKCKFIKEQQKDFKYYCISCYLNYHKDKQNFFISLSKLHYDEQNEWIRNILQNYNIFGLQQIKKFKSDAQSRQIKGIYLTICPTDKKVIVELCLIYQSKDMERLIIRPLNQNSKTLAKEVTQQLYKDHKYRNLFYIKVKHFSLILKQSNVEFTKKLKKYLQIDHIRIIQHQGIEELNFCLLKKQIQIRKENITLNQGKKRLEYFEKRLQNLNFVLKLHAQQIGIQNIHSFNKLSHLKHLYLKKNQIKGQIKIQHYNHLTLIDLSQNKISKISFQNMRTIKNIMLNKNQLEIIKFCDQIPITQLNISQNQHLTNIDIKNCPLLKIFHCVCKRLQTIHWYFDADLKEFYGSKINEQSYKCIQNSKIQKLRIKTCLHQIQTSHLLDLQQFIYHYQQNISQEIQFKSLQQIIGIFQFNTDLIKQESISQNLMKDDDKKLQLFLEGHKLLNQIQIHHTRTKIMNLSNLHHIEQFLIQSSHIQQLIINSVTIISIAGKNFKKLTVINPKQVKKLYLYGCCLQNNLCQSYPNADLFYLQNVRASNYAFSQQKSLKQITVTNPQKNLIQNKEFVLKDNPQINFVYGCDLNVSELQIINCPKLQNVLLYLTKPPLIKRIALQLLNLRQLRLDLSVSHIEHFYLMLSAQLIKKIHIHGEATVQNSTIQFGDDNHKIDLQQFLISNMMLNSTLFCKPSSFINSIKYMAYLFQSKKKIKSLLHQISPQQLDKFYELRLSNICSGLEQLTLCPYSKSELCDDFKIIIDIPMKALQVSNKIGSTITLQFQYSCQIQVREISCLSVSFEADCKYGEQSHLHKILLINKNPNEKCIAIFKVHQKNMEKYGNIVEVEQGGNIEFRVDILEETIFTI